MPLQSRYPHVVPTDLRPASEPVDLTQLGQGLRATFVELPPDTEHRDFVARSKTNPHSWILTRTHRIVRSFISDYDANGLLGMYSMHLLSTAQWTRLLGLQRAETLLDVGAGDGGLTQRLAPLFTSITTTETSKAMVRRLRRRGYACLEVDLSERASESSYDCITCLNVVDRTARPKQLVAALARMVAPGGLLVLATPLPIRAFFFHGARTLEPEERLCATGPSWERALTQFAPSIAALAPNFELQSWTKTAYLSWGDHSSNLYALDDFVGVWRRR